MTREERNDKLARTFNFNDTDLQSNRQGRIAEGQKQSIASARKMRLASLIVYFVMIAIFVLAFIGVGISLLFNRDGSLTRLAIMFAAAVATLIFAVSALNYYLRSRDLFAGSVSHLDGSAKLRTRQYSRESSSLADTDLGTGWFVKLGPKEFRLHRAEQYAAFEEGANYRIHYVKNYPLDVILSVEAL